ncbi:MAG: iron chaperone [Agromyces sp.]
MGAVDDYIAGLEPGADRRELERLHGRILALVPECGQGVSYNMACYLYRGKPVVAVVANARFLSWYPYSGRVLGQVSSLEGYSQTKGALHFSAEQPLGEAHISELLTVKMREIDESLAAK